MKFSFNGNNIEVSSPGTDSKQWKITVESEYRPDRSGFVLNKFKKDFSDINVSSADEVYALCSRSKLLNQWLAGVNSEYACSTAVPQYLKDLVNIDVFGKVKKEIEQISNESSKHAEELSKAADDYKNKVARLNKEYEDKVISKTKNDPILRVLTMNTTELPITIQLAIENYTPSKDPGSPTRRDYAREMLINYKQSLIKLINDKKLTSIDDVIKGLGKK